MTVTPGLYHQNMKDRRWMADAACRGCDPTIMFPERGESTAPGLAICAGCEVVQQCFNYCYNLRPQPDGIWGGTSHDVRKRRRRIKAVSA